MSEDSHHLSPDCLRPPASSEGELYRCNNAMMGQVSRTETSATLIVRNPAKPMVGAPTFQAPTIAVTNSTGSSTIHTKRATGKRTAKIEFVRFDSVETIFKQTDHDDVVQRAKIKDEIKRFGMIFAFSTAVIRFTHFIMFKFHK